jgi:CheY-like chemotaxis protein
MHGGSVSATSPGPGQGSEFVVRLPVQQSPPVAAPAKPGMRAPAAAQRLRVLVVDDNSDTADTLAALLKLEGHLVRLAHDGPTALATADNFHPDAVVLDRGLPGMDGFEVARRLRDRNGGPKPLLVAVSGYGRDEDRQRARQAGFDHHLVKPAEIGALTSLLTATSANS